MKKMMLHGETNFQIVVICWAHLKIAKTCGAEGSGRWFTKVTGARTRWMAEKKTAAALAGGCKIAGHVTIDAQ